MMDKAMADDQPYTIVRESEFYDRLFWMYYRLGLQSNLVVAAEYTNANHVLSRPAVAAALLAVIKAQPRLRHVLVPERRGDQQTHVKVGILRKIDVEKCIDFIDDDGKGVDAELVERLHNQWFDWAADKPSVPCWKVVVKGSHVIFVFSHGLGDGMSGYVFHREFLVALNGLSWPVQQAASIVVDATAEDAAAGAIRLAPLLVLPKPSILTIIWRALFYFLVGLFYGKRRLNYDYPPSRPYHQDFMKTPPAEALVTPRTSARRVPAADVSLILAECRRNGSTLTPLLSVLFVATMALDQSPKALMSTPAIAYDMRPLLSMGPFIEGSSPSGAGVMMNGAGGTQRPLLLARLRALFPDGRVDHRAFWSYLRKYKEDMTGRIKGESQKVFLAPQLLGPTLEDMVQKVYPRMDTHHNNLVSNLGAFSPVYSKEGAKRQWEVVDMQFSVSSTNGNVGPHGVIISVAGVKGKDLNIYASYEKEVVTRDEAEEILDGLIRRMYEVTGLSKP